MASLMDGLNAESYDRQYTDRQLYSRILQRLAPQKKRLLVLASVVFFQSMAGAGVPVVVGKTLDLLRDDARLLTLAGVVLLAMVLGMTDWLLNYRNQSLAARAIGELVEDLRKDSLNATLRRDMRFFHQNLPGRLISRITSDTQEMGALVTLVSDSLSSLLIVVLLISVMTVKNPTLTLLCLATLPLIMLLTLIFRSLARKRSTESRRILGLLNGQISESISGISVAKGFRQENAIYDAFQEHNQAGYRVNLQLGWTFNTIFPLLGILMGLASAIVVYFGGSAALRVEETGITPGDWYFFVQATGMVFFPLSSLASFHSQLQNGLASSERVFALLDADSELKQAEPGLDPGRLAGELRFEQVVFSYIPQEPVFRELNLHVKAGESVALVGHTGAGKSSIVNLLSRYYEFQGGSIKVDGHDIRSLNLDAWRRQLGVILQEQLLFDTTVLENVRYGRPDASEQEVIQALEQIGARSLIDELPEGLQTRVRERGSRLSLGQRQLVSMARTLLQNPTLLMMDEATASVDPLTEVKLQRALDRVMKGRTTLIVAHRLTTIRNVDRIVAIDKGKIVEEGTHDELLAKGGYYSTLYNTYYRHQSLDYIEYLPLEDVPA